VKATTGCAGSFHPTFNGLVRWRLTRNSSDLCPNVEDRSTAEDGRTEVGSHSAKLLMRDINPETIKPYGQRFPRPTSRPSMYRYPYVHTMLIVFGTVV
jgi:hypothetical protein